MTDTETVQTAYGDVEIEVVDCDSCGNTIGKEEAYRFAMYKGSLNKRFTEVEKNGYACKHCVDEGPINYPSERLLDYLKNAGDTKFIDGVDDIIFCVIGFPLFSLLNILAGVQNEFTKGLAVASLGAWVWFGVLLLLWFVL